MERTPLANNEKSVSEETRHKVEEILYTTLEPGATVGDIFSETSKRVDNALVKFSDPEVIASKAGILEKKSRIIDPTMKDMRKVWDILKQEVKKS